MQYNFYVCVNESQQPKLIIRMITSILPLFVWVLSLSPPIHTISTLHSNSRFHSKFHSKLTTLNAKVQVLYDSTHYLHKCIEYHPEQPERILQCVQTLQKYQASLPKTLLDIVDVSSKDRNDNTAICLTSEELSVARQMISLAHSESYIAKIESTCQTAKERRILDQKDPNGFLGYIDPDTYLTTESYGVLLRATSIWIRAVKNAMTNESHDSDNNDDPMSCMALTRPPGHHATHNLANGFCIVNFAATAAIYAIESTLASKVTILDWDIHYGQGITNILLQNSTYEQQIRYVSMHQCPAFPYQGEELRLWGQSENIFTVPVFPGMTWEGGYQELFENIVLPFVSSSSSNDDDKDGDYDDTNIPTENHPLHRYTVGGEWVPDLIIVCAGYDGLASDELASVNLEPKDYASMIRSLQQRIQAHHKKDGTKIGLMLGLEGGYQLQDQKRGLSAAVLETIQALCED